MADTIFGSGSDQWVCPNDRQLALRAKLQTGWSVHTYQTEKQRRSQSLSPAEVDAVLQVIQRAERLDVLEQQRVGRLVERLETMRRNALGNGLSQCLLCGEVLGFLGSSSVLCQDCRKKVCTKCGIETCPGQKRPLWLCKICSEQREVWKRSGAWFYKGLPKYILPLKTPGRADDPHFRPLRVEPAQPEPRSTESGRVYTWARGRDSLILARWDCISSEANRSRQIHGETRAGGGQGACSAQRDGGRHCTCTLPATDSALDAAGVCLGRENEREASAAA
ncbi:rab effector Noc2 isoform X3 [Oryctolagus cuniculus]|uniref:rab effector Noc2 isoform X3 n=1 Tax=Oryctolagus cuniculus TaxID=9986 RepID=UPI0007EE6FF4